MEFISVLIVLLAQMNILNVDLRVLNPFIFAKRLPFPCKLSVVVRSVLRYSAMICQLSVF